jgi:hypothetical protein
VCDVCVQVKFLEVVDTMVGHILSHLAAAQQQQQQQQQADGQAGPGTTGSPSPSATAPATDAYAVCITGDHSTPVVFGDHSHEPVPFTLAWVGDAVAAAGGVAALPGCHPGQRIPLPDVKQPPDLQQLLQQAQQQQSGDSSSSSIGAGASGVCWDGVVVFDELVAARGSLGRFPGSEVMRLIKEFLHTAA